MHGFQDGCNLLGISARGDENESVDLRLETVVLTYSPSGVQEHVPPICA